MAALIGEVASPVQPEGEDAVSFAVIVAVRGEEPERVGVFATGGQATACSRFLRPGHRVAVEGRVAPDARPAEVLADRIQFLTTRAEAEQLERQAQQTGKAAA